MCIISLLVAIIQCFLHPIITSLCCHGDSAEREEEEDQESQEVLEEQIVRQLTREYLDFLGEGHA